MSLRINHAVNECVLLENISWETYEGLLRDVGERHIYMSFDHGTLEIRHPSFGRERRTSILGAMIGLAAAELAIPIRFGGSTTIRSPAVNAGLEPDRCFWFQHESAMRGKKEWKADRDPVPDLAIEVTTGVELLNRMPIYASLRVPEVWHANQKSISVFSLGQDGRYRTRKSSSALPGMSLAKTIRFLKSSENQDETTVLRQFVSWLRAEVLPRCQAERQRDK